MDSEGREASGAHSQNYETSQPAENDVSEGVPAFAETLAETLAEPIGVVSVIEMSAEAGLDASFPDAMVDAENAVNRGSLGESTIHERVLSGTECAEPTVLAETSAEKRDVVPAGPVEAAPLPEPRREECTVMHCELSNHAVLVQSLPPAAFTALINQVLAVFESMVTAREGICDRLGSEGMRAFFRSQAGDSNHAETALQCALALRARLENVSQKCEMQCGYELDLRLGINSGEVVVAPFGSSAKSVLSVAGEPAEWAVRLAGANLLYGSKILLGARTSVFALGIVETRPIDLLQRQLPPEPPEEVFELLALRGSLAADALERLVRYREGVEHFRARRWREAAAALRAARPPRQEDDAIDLLLHRISEQEALADYVVEGH